MCVYILYIYTHSDEDGGGISPFTTCTRKSCPMGPKPSLRKIQQQQQEQQAVLKSGSWAAHNQQWLLQVWGYAATYCNILQHTATHCNILQHTAIYCNTLQHTATYCNTLLHTATYVTYCNTCA